MLKHPDQIREKVGVEIEQLAIDILVATRDYLTHQEIDQIEHIIYKMQEQIQLFRNAKP